jgi:hypothetical protein
MGKYNYVCVCVCVCNHVDLNIFIYKSFYKKKLKIFKISLLFKCMKIEDSNAFSIKLLDFLFNFFYRCVDLEMIWTKYQKDNNDQS